MEQAKRAAYIAGHLWGRSDTPRPELPPLTEWGYLLTASNIFIPRWTLNEHTWIYKRLWNQVRLQGKGSLLDPKMQLQWNKIHTTFVQMQRKMFKGQPNYWRGRWGWWWIDLFYKKLRIVTRCWMYSIGSPAKTYRFATSTLLLEIKLFLFFTLAIPVVQFFLVLRPTLLQKI